MTETIASSPDRAGLAGPPRQESLVSTAAELRSAMTRLNEILGGKQETNEKPYSDDFYDDESEDAIMAEIATIYSNVAYVFLYLDSNADRVDAAELNPWRSAFYDNSSLDRKLERRLASLSCHDVGLERTRTAFLANLTTREACKQESKELGLLFDRIDTERRQARSRTRDLLTRLGAPASAALPEVTAYGLLARTDDSGRREKLARAFRITRDSGLDDIVVAVDALVARRRDGSRDRGYANPFMETLTRCRVGAQDAHRMVEESLQHAVADHDELTRLVADGLGCSGEADSHFPRFVRQRFERQRVPLFPARDVIEVAMSIAGDLFGLAFDQCSTRHDNVLVFDVTRRDGGRAGELHLDLWDASRKSVKANTTHTLGSPAASSSRSHPIAYISCVFRRDETGADLITFQNVHSLFHEFGHAVNHMLLRDRLPSPTGLEFLPLERIEILSMWFEKWVYHRSFASALGLDGDAADDLYQCQQAKILEYRRTHVDRAVTAALDLMLHDSSELSYESAFAGLDERYSLGDRCHVGDFPGYFSWPMLRANPGAYFSYLWGAASSAAAFLPFLDLPLDSLSDAAISNGLQASLVGCYSFDEPSPVPASGATVSFYLRESDSQSVGERASKAPRPMLQTVQWQPGSPIHVPATGG